jgi:hypothetical protein
MHCEKVEFIYFASIQELFFSSQDTKQILRKQLNSAKLKYKTDFSEHL